MHANLKSGLTETYRTPAINHLAWLCQAPQLVRSPISFEPPNYLHSNYHERLKLWDGDHATTPPLLKEPPQRRLGFYFERLYQVFLEDLLGWPVLMKNQQIQSAGHTVGELDFVVHNLAEGRIEHHEIAVKFYLGVPEASGTTLWYGPNARDRLDIKTTSLLKQQSRRTRLPETIAMLSEAGINGPLTPRIFMPGYLFYPDAPHAITPDYVPARHLRGRWIHIHEAKALDTSCWVALTKPHWIGDWFQSEKPNAEHAEEALARAENRGVPQLFAVLREELQNGLWLEVDRIFVVPASWPNLH